MKHFRCYTYIFEIARHIGRMTDVARTLATQAWWMINEKFELLTYIFEVARHSGSLNDVARTEILFCRVKFRTSGGRRPSFAATIDFWCYDRSRDVGHTTAVSGDLKNVRLEFGIFQLSFTLMEWLLHPVYGGFYLIRGLLQYVSRRRSFFRWFGRLRKYMLSHWNFSPMTCRCGHITTSGRRRPYLISVNHVG